MSEQAAGARAGEGGSPLLRPGCHGAFVADEPGFGPPQAAPGGRLDGLRLAVKDVFDHAGLRTGAGNPRWREQQRPAVGTAAAVSRLLAAGARWVGRTVTDELTYSLAGINAHYGTPENPASPARIPGGSSSGSAVAVAAGHADIALGTDCGGSVRLPASYGGLWGMRPTHGRVPTRGCFTLAHSFDTVGWFARDGEVLAAVFESLAHAHAQAGPADEGEPAVLRVSERVARLLDPAVREAWTALCASGRLGRLEPVAEADDAELALPDWASAFRTLQAGEVWMQHGDWYRVHGDALGPEIRQRMAHAAGVGAAQVSQAQRLRVQASRLMARLLGCPGTVLLMPTVPSIAPRRDDGRERVEDVRQRSQQLLCIAGLAGLPQVSLPWTRLDGATVGLSVIGARGDDEHVLRVARRMHRGLQRST